VSDIDEPRQKIIAEPRSQLLRCEATSIPTGKQGKNTFDNWVILPNLGIRPKYYPKLYQNRFIGHFRSNLGWYLEWFDGLDDLGRIFGMLQ
jgi:hypothetical protein